MPGKGLIGIVNILIPVEWPRLLIINYFIHEMFWTHRILSALRSFYSLAASDSEIGVAKITQKNIDQKISTTSQKYTSTTGMNRRCA
jgi:hypothetical protein